MTPPQWLLSLVIVGLILPLAPSLSPSSSLRGLEGLAQTSQAVQAKAKRLLNLGEGQLKAFQFEAARQSWQQALGFYRQLQDRRGEGQVLGLLGDAYIVLGNYDQGMDHYQRSLAIARETKDRQAEVKALMRLGMVGYDNWGDYSKAIEYYEQSLAIARKIKDRRGEG